MAGTAAGEPHAVMTAVGRLRDMSWYAHLRSSSPCLIRPRLFSFSPAPRSPLTNAATSRIPWFTSIPSFRQQLARTNKVPSFGERVRCPSVRNQVLVSTRNASPLETSSLTRLVCWSYLLRGVFHGGRLHERRDLCLVRQAQPLCAGMEDSAAHKR